jgi:hypothetical protein
LYIIIGTILIILQKAPKQTRHINHISQFQPQCYWRSNTKKRGHTVYISIDLGRTSTNKPQTPTSAFQTLTKNPQTSQSPLISPYNTPKIPETHLNASSYPPSALSRSPRFPPRSANPPHPTTTIHLHLTSLNTRKTAQTFTSPKVTLSNLPIRFPSSQYVFCAC